MSDRDRMYLDWAESIATLIISRNAAAAAGRCRSTTTPTGTSCATTPAAMSSAPSASRPGTHSNGPAHPPALGTRRPPTRLAAQRAASLFRRATRTGWDKERGGFLYTLDWDGKPHLRNRLWWPAAEGIGAAAFLNQIDGAPEYEEWYRRIWDFIADALIDRERGGWRTEPIDPTGAIAPLFSASRPLSRAPGLPDPAPPDHRVDHPASRPPGLRRSRRGLFEAQLALDVIGDEPIASAWRTPGSTATS